ncbi:outer membrane protein transport protein [Myxococcota bacterium]|nr:outer membrane protein transport protein [Myxococcota bacterium]
MRNALLLPIGLVVLLGFGQAWAAGYDTPILFTARHMGMGGAAIGYVDEASALYHNPAGLGHVGKLSLSAAFSPVMGHIGGSPGTYEAGQSLETEFTLSPFFLVGGAWRANDWLTLGLAVFPSAGAGGEYKYPNQIQGKADYTDITQLSFIEFTPGLAVNLGKKLRLGLGYRAILTSIDREKKTDDGENITFDMHLQGWAFSTFRAGLQYTPIKGLDLGVTYRHRAEITTEGDEASIVSPVAWGHTEMDFNLPTKIGMGLRYSFGPLALAFDAEYGFNSENEKQDIVAQFADDPQKDPFIVTNWMEWENAWTLRPGLEFKAMDGALPLRIGYVYDGPTVKKKYPTAFGTPAGAASHTITAGAGYQINKRLQCNAAYAYRMASSEVTKEDKEGAEVCIPCGADGDYTMALHGVYVDLSYSFN